MKALLEWLKVAIGERAVALLLARLLTKENVKKAITELLDYAEALALKTDTPIDNMIVAKLKEIAGIPKAG